LPSAKTERSPSGIALPALDPAAAKGKPKKGEGRERHWSAKVPTFTNEQFQKECDAIQPQDWGRYGFYVYRSHPVIDHKLSGREHAYLEKVERSVGDVRAYVLNQHAGGEYFLVLDDKNKQTGTAVCRTSIEIPWHEAPPVLNVEELVLGHPRNKGYEEFLRARGQHPEQESYMRPPYPPPQQAGSVSDIVKLVVPILDKALNKEISPAEKGYIEYLKGQAESAATANDPTKLISLLAGLKDLIAPAAPAGDSASKVAIDMLRDELKAMREANADLQRRLFDSFTKKAESPSLLSQVKEIAGVFAAVKELLPRAQQAAAVDSRTAMIQAVSEAAQPILDALPAVLQTWAMTRAQQAGIRVEPGVHYPLQPQVMPPSAEPAQPAGDEATPAPNGTAGGPQMIPPQMLHLASELGRMMFSAIEREIPGDEWARSFIDLNGLTMYRQICGLGRDRILQVLVSIPEFAPRVESLGGLLVQFIDDFLAGPNAVDEDDPQQPEPIHAPPPAAAPAAPRPTVTFRQPPAASPRESPGPPAPPSRMTPAAAGAPRPAPGSASPTRAKTARARKPPGAPNGGADDGS
jgi:hypothetical protein